MIELISEEQWKQYLPGFTPIAEMTPSAARQLHNEAIEQATSVPRHGYSSGHAGAIATPEQYELLETEQPRWNDPKHPGMHPLYPPLATETQKKEAEATHLCALNEWKNWTQLNLRMRANLDKAIDNNCKFTALPNGTSTFGALTPQGIINRIVDEWAKPTPREIEDNESKLTQPFDQHRPIMELIRRLQQAKLFANWWGGNKITDSRLTTSMLARLEACPVYTEYTKRWNRRGDEHKTWKQCQRFFMEAYREIRNTVNNTVTSGTYNYGTAFNAIQDDDDRSVTSQATVSELTRQIGQSVNMYHELSQNLQERDMEIERLRRENEQLHHMANLSVNRQNVHPIPSWQPYPPPPLAMAPPPFAHGQQPPPPASYNQPPPASPYKQRGTKNNPQQRSNTRGYGGYGGNTGGQYKNAGGTGGYVPPQVGYHQHVGGQTQTGRGYGMKREPHPRKFYPNMLYCYSCGFDVDHDGTGCPPHKQKEHHLHHATMTREQARQWMKDDRFKGSHKGSHKTQWRDGSATGERID